MKIGLALSGGGFRATVFHLGVLARLAEDECLEEVSFLSTVSGGTLCAGLIFAKSDFSWPTSSYYLEEVVPKARELTTTIDLRLKLIWRMLRSPLSIFETRADDLSALLKRHWGITESLSNLPEQPRWMINATCYETGKNWRFERFRMGDYVFGYTNETNIPISDAIAASAGFPGLIGPLELNTSNKSWFEYVDQPGGGTASEDSEQPQRRTTKPKDPAYPTVHLWDGGVYDNHGLEGLHNFSTGWRKGIDFLIVSDAAAQPKSEKYQPGTKALLRIITGIMMNQIRSLRTRAVLERLNIHQDAGSFIKIGNTCKYVLEGAKRKDEVEKLCEHCLGDEEVKLAAGMKTEIERLPEGDFDRLFRHGFEVADYTLYAYNPDKFNFLGFMNSRSKKLYQN